MSWPKGMLLPCAGCGGGRGCGTALSHSGGSGTAQQGKSIAAAKQGSEDERKESAMQVRAHPNQDHYFINTKPHFYIFV